MDSMEASALEPNNVSTAARNDFDLEPNTYKAI